MKTKEKEPKILFYDIETAPLKAYVWGLGKQVVRHGQLIKNAMQYGIICITYCWNDGKPAQSIDWGYEEQDTAKVVAEFDKIIKEADHIIGKNNKNFDDKMLNAARMLNGLEPLPYWSLSTDDLERQMRRFFRLPSHSLDYISEQLGYGGKIKMEFSDWINIVEKTKDGEKCFNKMIKYGKKDVVDTRAIWNHVKEYVQPRFNVAAFKQMPWGCKHCGSQDLYKNGREYTGAVVYQQYGCRSCNRGYAGRCSIRSNTGRLL